MEHVKKYGVHKGMCGALTSVGCMRGAWRRV